MTITPIFQWRCLWPWYRHAREFDVAEISVFSSRTAWQIDFVVLGIGFTVEGLKDYDFASDPDWLAEQYRSNK